MAAAADAKSCRKCKAENATFDLRNLPTCQYDSCIHPVFEGNTYSDAGTVT